MLAATSRRIPQIARTRLRSSPASLARRYSTQTDNPIPANPGPNTPQRNSPVSATNELPTSSEGSHDRALQESVEKGEELRTTQAPNRKGIWSRSQQPREKAMAGPRFEQMIMADQVGFNRSNLISLRSGRLSVPYRRELHIVRLFYAAELTWVFVATTLRGD